MIEDKATCDAAAAALGLSDTSASTSSATYYAPGCVLRSSSLYLYPATNSYACASNEQCICALRPPSPPAPPLEPPAPPAPPSLPPGYVAAVNGYYQLKSGSCGAAAMITDVDECNEAAEALGQLDTSTSTSSGRPGAPGCVLGSSSLYLYPQPTAMHALRRAVHLQPQAAVAAAEPEGRAAVGRTDAARLVAADGAYYQLESCSCGGAVIEDKASCDAAAEALFLSDTTAYESASTSYPPGCVLSYGSLYLYPATNSYSADRASSASVPSGRRRRRRRCTAVAAGVIRVL